MSVIAWVTGRSAVSILCRRASRAAGKYTYMYPLFSRVFVLVIEITCLHLTFFSPYLNRHCIRALSFDLTPQLGNLSLVPADVCPNPSFFGQITSLEFNQLACKTTNGTHRRRKGCGTRACGRQPTGVLPSWALPVCRPTQPWGCPGQAIRRFHRLMAGTCGRRWLLLGMPRLPSLLHATRFTFRQASCASGTTN